MIIPGLVTIPLQNTKLGTSKAGEPVLTKTIQLTSAQMVGLAMGKSDGLLVVFNGFSESLIDIFAPLHRVI